MSATLRLIRPGDRLVLLAAGIAVAASFPLLWRGGAADKAVVRAGGRLVAELPLTAARTLEVPGPLGITRIEVQPGRARVAADPGPRQYCVRQGWLSQANSIAICAPNQVSLRLVGRHRSHDSVTY